MDAPLGWAVPVDGRIPLALTSPGRAVTCSLERGWVAGRTQLYDQEGVDAMLDNAAATMRRGNGAESFEAERRTLGGRAAAFVRVERAPETRDSSTPGCQRAASSSWDGGNGPSRALQPG